MDTLGISQETTAKCYLTADGAGALQKCGATYMNGGNHNL